ncbi:MAG: NAD(P)H-binding protein [Polyangiaceae bacterium]
MRRVLVTGATGFVGRALVPALVDAGYDVRATTRDLRRGGQGASVEWVRCDVQDRAELERALEGREAAFFLVHGMGEGRRGYAEMESRVALSFREAAARAGLQRIVYLGGVAPRESASEHLKSRLSVGAILRGGSVPVLELRASMIIGYGSASWQIVRDLAMRLPAMVLPAWTMSRTCPLAIDDAVVALVRGLLIPLPESACYDIPGPEEVSARDMLSRVAALRGRRIPSISVPFLSVSLSSWWLKLVTRTDFSLARELVLGLTSDLLPESDRYWDEIGVRPKLGFDEAARRALLVEEGRGDKGSRAARVEESLVQLVSPGLADEERGREKSRRDGA